MPKLDDLVVIKVNRKLGNENFNALVQYYQSGLKSGFILLDEDCELVHPKAEETRINKPKWIDINDQKPPCYKLVCAFFKNDRGKPCVESMSFNPGEYYTKNGHYPITHWMPLPEPPEE